MLLKHNDSLFFTTHKKQSNRHIARLPLFKTREYPNVIKNLPNDQKPGLPHGQEIRKSQDKLRKMTKVS